MDPIEIKNISSLLDHMNLKKYQKSDHFHILKIEEHYGELPHNICYRSGDFFEVSFAKRFDVEIGVDATTFSANAETGYLMFTSPGQIVNIDVKEVRNDSTGYIVFFSAEFLNFVNSTFSIVQKFQYFNMHSSPVYFLKNNQSDLMINYMEMIYKEFKSFNEVNVEIIKSWFTILLFESSRLLDNKELRSSSHSRAEEITYQFENLLKSNLSKERKIEYYAEKLNISSVYLSECVKKVTGITAKKIIIEYIVASAKAHLSDRNNILEQVAFTSGFDDVSNFSNFFKKYVGLTPSQYRKSING